MLERNKNNIFAQRMITNPKRSKFPMNSRLKTTFDSAKLVPLKVMEIIPGDTVSMNVHQAVRMATPIFPVMDTAFLDHFWFFVPNRILWDNYKYFFGENKTPEEWANPTEYEIPQIKSPEGGWGEGTLADYFGLPTKTNIQVSHLPFRAYCMIWNEFFRNVSLQTPTYINEDETTMEGMNTIEDYVTDAQKGGGLLPVARLHDYFNSALIQPARGRDVMLPVAGASGSFPVIGTGIAMGLTDGTNNGGLYGVAHEANSLFGLQGAYGVETGNTSVGGSALGGTIGLSTDPEKSGLKAVVANTVGGATMNDFFKAYAIQQLLYRDGITGTRYRSLIKGHFNITIPDSTAQVPEYLGGGRFMINMDQVLQTSATNEVSPQGNVSGYSLTSTSEHAFTKSFTEPGILMCVACVRNVESYQQGIPRYWSKKKRFDFYWPALRNIADQRILNKEIYAQGNSQDEEVFGYQKRWADMQYSESNVTGAFRSNYNGSLDAWHYANYFDELPTLAGLNNATDANIERTLAVENEPQFIRDIYFNADFIREMPLQSIPGIRTYM